MIAVMKIERKHYEFEFYSTFSENCPFDVTKTFFSEAEIDSLRKYLFSNNTSEAKCVHIEDFDSDVNPCDFFETLKSDFLQATTPQDFLFTANCYNSDYLADTDANMWAEQCSNTKTKERLEMWMCFEWEEAQLVIRRGNQHDLEQHEKEAKADFYQDENFEDE
uniref:Uncharacterized protein n=1 Tax=Ditylenchus dipsaci TaxID=166011 RepID=A0A915DJU6_9BILA